MTATTAEHAQAKVPHFVIRPKQGWQVLNIGELVAYRDLFYFLMWRDIKVRYAQSILGIGWAIIQPLFSTLLFTGVFFYLAKMRAPGGDPYVLFSACATIPWAFFSSALNDATSSLAGQGHMISKVYFPRLVIPLTAVLGKLIDFAIAFGIFLVLLVVSGRVPGVMALTVPVLLVLMILAASGLGMWTTALAIQYRDIRYAMGFVVQLAMYASPVIYSTTTVAENAPSWLYVYALNPMVGIIEGFRSALLGSTPMPWDLIGVSAVVSLALFVSGAFYFKRMERHFADVA